MADLFDNDVTETTIDPNVNYFEALVGENKKYKDAPAAGRAIVEKDAFIEQLKRENAQFRDELKTKTSMEDFLTKIEASRAVPPLNSTTQETTPVETAPAKTEHKGLSQEDVERLLTEREVNRQKETNLNKAKESLKQAFGANYSEVLKAKAAELGVSAEFLTSIAQTTPAALLTLVGADKAPTMTNTLPNGSLRSSQPNAGTQGKKFADFEKIRKEDQRKYWSTAVQAEMHAEAQKQGEAFYS